MKIIVRLLGFLRPFAAQVILSVLLGVATIASAIGLLGASADLIARAALHPSIATLQVAIVSVRFFGISRAAFRYLERLVSHSVNFRLLAQFRTWFYRAVEPLAPARLMDYQGGDLLSRAIADIETLENFYVRAVAPPLVALIVTIGMSLFIGSYHPELGLLLAGGLLVSGVGVPVVTRILARKPGRQIVAARSHLSAAIVDGLQGMPELLLYNRSDAALDQINHLGRQMGAAQMRLAWAGGLANALNLGLMLLTLWGILWLSIPLVSADVLPGVLLAVLVQLTLASFESVLPLASAAQNLETSLEAGRRLFSLADLPPMVSEPAVPLPPPANSDLELVNLTFSYAPELPPALRNLSAVLPLGRRIAIVGPSGAGKSTLSNLLLRFWPHIPGQILLGGQPLSSYSLSDSRKRIGVISPHTMVFTATLRENLCLAQPAAADAELISVLTHVQLSEWFSALPNGLDTWLGEQGHQMSAGERQRLALARLLLQNAPIWILDEPTANLDALTEQALIQTLLALSAGHTVIWITHRLIGLDALDEIIALDAGIVMERGRHADLISADGLYAHLWRLQNRQITS